MEPEASEEHQPGRLADAESSGRAPVGAPERYGPVALQREVKDDGRVLLIYAHAEAHAEGEKA